MSDINPRIPADLHPAVRIAQEAWREIYPGMEPDATAEVIVLALASKGLIRRGGAA